MFETRNAGRILSVLLAGFLVGCGADSPVSNSASSEARAEQLFNGLTEDQNNTIVLSELLASQSSLSLNDSEDSNEDQDVKVVLEKYGVLSQYIEDGDVREKLFGFLQQVYPILRDSVTDERKREMLNSIVIIGAGAISGATGMSPAVTLAILDGIVDMAWERYLERKLQDPQDEADEEKSKRRRKSLDSQSDDVEMEQKKEIIQKFLRKFVEENFGSEEELREALEAAVAKLKTRLEARLKELSEAAMQRLEEALAELADS